MNPGPDQENGNMQDGWCWVEPYVEDTNAKVFKTHIGRFQSSGGRG